VFCAGVLGAPRDACDIPNILAYIGYAAMIVMSVPNNYMYEIQMKINKKKVIGCIFTQRKGISFYYEKLFLFKD
jgi:hypothetical protein